MIDTGAEISAIFKSVAKRANVFPLGMRDMISANHAEPASIYIVDLQVHLNEIVQIPTLEVVGFEDHGRSTFHALLGRDVLCKGKGSFFMENGVYELCL